MFVETCTRQTVDDWIRLRHALWPQTTEHQHRLDALALLDRPREAVAFVVRNDDLQAIGFAEATVRRDYVNGCTTSPVAFLEGIYVAPDWRTLGIARLLCAAVEQWAVRLGCGELASDTELGNVISQQMHRALGFQETERVVFYRKPLLGD